MTGTWEKRLHDISIGNEEYTHFVADMEQTVREWYNLIVSTNAQSFSSDDELICPLCGKKVLAGKFGYFCSAKKDAGCKFSIPKKLCEKEISDTQAKRMITKGKTTLIKGFKSKSGKTFDAYLLYNKSEQKISFEFQKKKD